MARRLIAAPAGILISLMTQTSVLAATLGLALGLAGTAHAQAPAASTTPAPTGLVIQPALRTQAMPFDEQSYQRETVFGINFNTQGALIGGINVRVARVLDEHWLRFWSLEGVSFKNPKEESVSNHYTGGSFKLPQGQLRVSRCGLRLAFSACCFAKRPTRACR
ncbi:MAG: hypothetical protein WKG07_09090 [Hymenobacter sp.]